MGKPRLSKASSTSWKSAPSSTISRQSASILVRIRFTRNPAESFTRIPVFLNCLAAAKTVARVISLVCWPRMISTRGSTATGLKKWNPTTRSGCLRFEAISETDRLEVLVAKMQVSETTCSASAKTCCLISICSNTASMTKSQSEKSVQSRVPFTRVKR